MCGKPLDNIVDSNSPFNIWAKARWQGIVEERGGTKGEGDFGLLMTGIDYRFNKNSLIGVLIQMDIYDNVTASGHDSQGRGWGWMQGPYLVTRFWDNLIWDIRVAWGQSKNEIKPLILDWEEYDGERWQFETNLTGDMELNGWKMLPQLGVNYFSEEQQDFTSSNGTHIGSKRVEIGTATFGYEVSHSWALSEKITVEPFIAVKGIWDFKPIEIFPHLDTAISTEDVRIKTEAGWNAVFQNGSRFYVRYAYDGISVSGYEADSVEVSASIPVHIGPLSKGSTFNTTFTQSVSDNYAGKFMFQLDVPIK